MHISVKAAGLFFVIIASAIVGTATDAHSQDLLVTLYHGAGTSGIVEYSRGLNGKTYETPVPKISRISLGSGDSICFIVRNAHTVFYNYTPLADVAAVKETMPDIAALTKVLAGTLPRSGRSYDAIADLADRSAWVGTFFNLVQPLADKLEDVQSRIKSSDDEVKGIEAAKTAVAELPAKPTQEEINAWAQTATPSEPEDKLVLAALKAYGQSLVSTRATLQSRYPKQLPATSRSCIANGDGKTTATLKVGRKVDFAARDSSVIATVITDRAYERGFIEAYPAFFVANADDVPQFYLDNDGRIQSSGSQDDRLYKPGANVVVNLFERGAVAIGPALGIGLTTDGDLSLSDILVSVVASYKTLFRIGLGVGSTTATTGLSRTVVVGSAIPEGKKLEDLTTTGDRRAWYISVGIPGLNIKSPF